MRDEKLTFRVYSKIKAFTNIQCRVWHNGELAMVSIHLWEPSLTVLSKPDRNTKTTILKMIAWKLFLTRHK